MTILHSFGDRVDPWTLVLVTTGGLIALSYVVQRLVERPIAQAMRRRLKSAEFGFKAPAPRRRS
ncbi:hypothetical protein [Streptomyces sp. NPDC018321]|uniref:hypothetical protein n=1 Tax=Streptomyces sp. NPDC018321 TaxID=3365043 RepID=UPI0037B57ED7